MDRNTSLSLLGVTLIMLGYTSYYAVTRPPVVPVATTTPEVIGQVIEDKNLLKTRDGKTIRVEDTHPVGESLSTITLTTTGFATNTPIILEKNKLTDFFLTDLNNDGHEELVLVTVAQGSGSYGDISLFTTASDTELLPISAPELTEDMTKSGGLFEGYMGHDAFKLENGALVREFPLYNASDTESTPTGGFRKVYYTLIPDMLGGFTVKLDRGVASTTLETASTTSITTSTSTVSKATTTQAVKVATTTTKTAQ